MLPSCDSTDERLCPSLRLTTSRSPRPVPGPGSGAPGAAGHDLRPARERAQEHGKVVRPETVIAIEVTSPPRLSGGKVRQERSEVASPQPIHAVQVEDRYRGRRNQDPVRVDPSTLEKRGRVGGAVRAAEHREEHLAEGVRGAAHGLVRAVHGEARVQWIGAQRDVRGERQVDRHGRSRDRIVRVIPDDDIEPSEAARRHDAVGAHHWDEERDVGVAADRHRVRPAGNGKHERRERRGGEQVATGAWQGDLPRPDRCQFYTETAARNPESAATGSGVRNTAWPATNTSAPAARASRAVSSAIPPSTSITKSSFFRARSSRAALTFSSISPRNACPPKPGSTVITRNRSRSGKYGAAAA